MTHPIRSRCHLLLGLLLGVTGMAAGASTLEVRGSVLSPSRAPLPGARVHLLPDLSRFALAQAALAGELGAKPVATTETDASGHFLLAGPAAGLYRVTVEAEGYAPVATRALPLTGITELVPVAPPQSGAAHVRVLDAAGRPLPGARVLARSAAEKQAGRELSRGWELAPRLARTAADGQASLPRLPEEKLEIFAFVPGNREARAELAAPGEIELRLPAAAPAVTIEAVGDDGQVVPGALILAGRGDQAAAVTGADGRATLPAPPRSTLRVAVLAPDGRRWSGEVAPSEAAAPVRITLPARRAFAGVVRIAESPRPLAGALVWLPEEPGIWAATDSEGRYRLSAPISPHVAHVAAAGYLSRQVRTTAAAITAGQLPTLALQPAAALAGKATDPSGTPAAGIAVAAIPAGASPGLAAAAAWSVSDRAGSFELRGLLPGSPYQIQVAQAGFLAEAQTVPAPAPGAPARPLRLVVGPSPGARGRVLTAGKPLAGVEVLLRSAAPPRRSELLAIEPLRPEEKAFLAATDNQGRFTVHDLPALRVDLIARKPGFAPAVLRGLRILAGKKDPTVLGDVVLLPAAQLAGRVVDRSGHAIARAAIYRVERLDDLDQLVERLSEQTPDATSQAAGDFRLADLAPGSPVHLLIAAEGFSPAGVRGVRAPTAAPIVVHLEPAAAVRGRVVDEAGQAVAGARAQLEWTATLAADPRMRTGRRVHRSAASDRQGKFELRNVPSGPAKISLTAEGFVASEPTELTVPQEPAATLTVVLRRGGTLRGRVSTRGGEPVGGVRIAAHEALAVSDDDGRYLLSGLPLGSLAVEVMHPHYPRQVKTLEVTGGADVLDVQLADGFRVTGVVLSERREPVAGALVSLEQLARGRGQRMYRAHSGTDGRFELRPVADGEYRLAAEAVGFAESKLAGAFTVRGEDREGLEISLERGGAITGRVSGLPREELAWVEVSAHSDDPEAADPTVRVDASGRYELRHLAPGNWRVQARHPQRQRAVEARVLVRGSEEAVRDLRFGSGLSLTGRVDADGEPAAGATVSLRGKSRALEQSAVTDYQGEFRLEDLEEDTYHLGVTHRETLSVHNEEVVLTADRQIEVHLRMGKVAGTVLDDATRAPLERALLALRPLEGPEFLIAGSSDADGGFLLPRVPAGRYRLTASAEGYKAAEQQLEVPAGGEVGGLEVALKPVQGLDLLVRIATGQIPSQVHLQATAAGSGAKLTETRAVGVDGKVRLATLPAGAWELWIAAPGGAAVERSVQVPGEPVNVVLPPAGSLTVHVPDLEESSWLGAVSVVGADRRAFATPTLGGALTSSWQLVAGTGRVEGLPAGAWTAVAQAPDGRVWEGQVTTTGRDAEVTLHPSSGSRVPSPIPREGASSPVPAPW